jgi:actin-related protein 9
MSALSPAEAPADPAIVQQNLLDLVKQIWESDLIRVPSDGETAADDDGVTDIAAVLVAGKEKAVIESGMKKKATAKASAAEQARAREIEALDLVTIDFHGQPLTVGKERYRFCEPLFDPNLMNGITGVEPRKNIRPLQDVVGHAVGQTEIDQRQYIWAGLFVTGELTNHVKGQSCKFPLISSERTFLDQESALLCSHAWRLIYSVTQISKQKSNPAISTY